MAYQVTKLSVKDAEGGYVTFVGDTTRETYGFDAETAIVAAAATLRDLNAKADLVTRTSGQTGQPPPIESVSIAGTVVNVLLSGFTRGADYELTVTFETAGGRKWPKTRIFSCLA
jgi:hypothetical protein